jgi:hypothetical protein
VRVSVEPRLTSLHCEGATTPPLVLAFDAVVVAANATRNTTDVRND